MTLRYRLLGPSGLRVSEVCLGTMTFGESRAWGADEATAHAILDRFAEAGGTLIDTAPNYAGGAAEEIVGRYVAGRRDRFVIGTKFTASADPHVSITGNGRKAMRASVEASLRRLGTDHIDLLWLHFWDGTAPLDEILRGLDDLVTQGKVLHIGLSDTPAWLASRAATLAQLRASAPVAAVQIEYSVAARSAERELLPMAEALDLGVLCWGPLAAGALAGGDDPRRRSRAQLPGQLAEVAEGLAAIARDAGVSPLALALYWVLRHPRWHGLIPILGARRPDHLAAALDAMAEDIDLSHHAARLEALAPVELGFPHDLIASPYLRKMALGGIADRVHAPRRPKV
jgi:aryl-alcohol dehydrogenase-like predicted oxidoreductase